MITRLLALSALAALSLRAQPFIGTNAPNTGSNYTFSVSAAATNLALVVSNHATVYSHLLLARGRTPTAGDFDFIARLNGATNRIVLQPPEFVATNYGLRVFTPAASAQHPFSVALTTNRTDLRTAPYPVLKPLAFSTTGTLTNAPSQPAWHYFQVDVPTNLPGWRLVLNTTNAAADLYVRKDDLPTIGSYTARSTGQPVDTVILNETAATPGTWFLGVYLPTGAATNTLYTLSAELGWLTTLTWDPGTADGGTQVFTNQSPTGGDYYFRVTTLGTANGAWRSALRVLSGEADLYLRLGSPAQTNFYNYASTRVGSDGVVLAQANQFSPGQEWYLTVHATPGAQWTLLTGEAYVQPLPALAADASSGGSGTIGPEGMRFFKTSITAGTLGWRLWLNGLTNQMLVHNSKAPLLVSSAGNGYYDWSGNGQLLIVPPYLVTGNQYFVGVIGSPGTVVNLDSRQQEVSDLAFNIQTNFTVTGYGYRTYRVQVPVQQIAWQINLTPSSGDPNLAIRRDNVPNEYRNDAYSEVTGSAGDSVTLVPPTLSDGTFYITTYGATPYTCALTNGQPIITDVNYIFAITNDAPGRAGWRFYRVPDTAPQLGTYGWDLWLSNHVAGSEIALRRNAVPGRWNYRACSANCASSSTTGYADYSSTLGFLQRPGHQADIWYIGVHQPAAPLGPFVLRGQELTATPLAFDPGAGSASTVVNQPPLKWQYYVMIVPTNAVGWELRLTNILSGDPRLTVCRDRLPYDLGTHYYAGNYWYFYWSATWPSGNSWAPDYDWANYSADAYGASLYGKLLQMGMGNPLEPGTYYVGVRAPDGATTPISYTLLSRGIGTNFAIPVIPLAYAGGSAGTNALPVREAAYYRVDVPSNAPSWKVRLSVTNEAMLAVQLNALPNIACGGSASTSLAGGRRLQKAGDEEYLLLPLSGQSHLTAGPYYVAVVSEGQNPVSGRYGSNACGFALTSFGPAPTNLLGTLDISGAATLAQADSLRGGEMKFYQFTVPPGALAMEVRLDDRVGNPRMTLRADRQLPHCVSSYGRDNGQPYTWQHDNIITIATPTATNYTLAVQADTVSGYYSNATYTVRVRALTSTPLAFDGGALNIASHTNGYWRFFQVTVPADALGWDLRLSNAVGDPRLVVCRDLAPNGLFTGNYAGGYWYWYQATTWPSSNQITADYDWTGWTYENSGSNSYGKVMQMGMGNPLQPGNYYVGVLNGSGNIGAAMSYSIVSRGIGTNHSIRVLDLPFAGSVSSNGLPARQAAYYRVQVPANAGSWKLRLEPTLGEAMLTLQKDFLPSTAAGNLSPVTVAGGRALQKTGVELHTLLPRTTEAFITNGTYYVAVASEGQNPGGGRIGSNACNFILQGLGAAPTNQLGTVDPSGLTDITSADTLEGGDLNFYQFNIPPGTLNLEVRLENRVGNPHMTLRAGGQLIRGVEAYGQSDGQSYSWSDASLINLGSPTVTNYLLTVQARTVSGGYSNASYTIRLHATGLLPLAFDNGAASVAGQAPDTWKYFTVTVPPGAQGWDLRLTNVTSGDPRLVIRRDTLPDGLSTHTDVGGYWYWYNGSAWPSGYQVNAGYDWTGWQYDNNGSNSYGRVFQTGMGNPLSPGTYIVGVINPSGTAPMSYTVFSRGIGAGYAIPVGAAPFVGSVTNNNLPARQAAYYRVDVPAGQANWKLRLSSSIGESMLMLQRSNLVNVSAGSVSPTTLSGGRALQKGGNEHYLLLPESGQTTIPGGTYYVALASEGQNPGASSRIGSNTCSSILTSYGPLAELALGSVGGADLTHNNSLEAGEIRLYNFNVPAGAYAVECRLENIVGTAVMTLRQGAGSPTPYYSYGRNGGQGYTWAHQRIITLPNVAAGLYSLAIHAESANAASHTLRVRHLTPANLAFDATLSGPGLTNVIAGSLEDLQKQFFVVTVPALFQGQPVVGWKLDLDNSSGNPRLRVRKDSLPNDSLAGNTPYRTSLATIVPPYLTPGTWYVEVQGQGASTFSLRSSAVRPERPAWAMPAVGGTVTTPGLPPAGPLFGDTGVGTNGVALPGDQGIDLEQGRMHYYAITIPSNNVGIIRTRLDALSGNPDLYLRGTNAPTLTHSTSGDTGSVCYDRSLTANAGSEYGNWVPLNGRFELQLPPGTWYLGVQAAGASNVRYRLRCYTGIITPLPFDGTAIINQTLAAGDWRYYQVTLPVNCPTTWNATFAQTLGDVVMCVRDTTPPGNGSTATDYRHWGNDDKNHGPYALVDPPGTTNLPCPPLRPGHTYYLGFRAVNDATFSVSSTTNATPIHYTNVVPFYSGFYSNTLPPNGVLKLRVDVPPDGRRLILSTVCSNTVAVSLSQGSVPRLDGRHASWSGTSTFNQALYTGTWPWQPGYMYFLLVTNNTALDQSFVLNADGRNAATDDNDGDGLPDAWELACWGSIYSYNGASDPDGDGVNNQEEHLEGTIPCDANSFRPRLLINAVAGTVGRNPAGSATLTPPKVSYPLGQNVQLTAVPDPGYSFLGWAGDASGAVNPLALTMNGHRTITAMFGITNNSGADYQFQLSLTSSVPAPPALQNIGAGNTFVTTAVDGCPRTVLRFPQGNGLLLQPTTGVLPTNTYTIVMLFRFDTVSGWKRVLDFKAGASDNGLYLLNGGLYLYPNASGPAGTVTASNWVQVVLTRDAAKTVVGYVNGVQQFSFTDAADHAVISAANALRFFKDNNSITEEGPGEVARVRLYAAPMTAAQVALLDRTDCQGVPRFLTPWFGPTRILNLPVTNVTPGVTYRLLGTTNFTTWSGVVTSTPVANPATFQDVRATNHPRRFYQLVTP